MRTVIITGALRGLGYELSRQLVQLGKYRVILTSRNSDQAEHKLYELEKDNHTAILDYHTLDVTQPASIKEFSKWFEHKYTKYDVLVANAGMKDSQAPGETKFDKGQNVINTNLYGVIDTAEILLPLLSDDGKVVVSSGIVGKLQFQKKPMQEILSNPNIKKEDIMLLAANLMEQMKADKVVDFNKSPETAYFASKALINCYARFVLSKHLKPQQSVYNVHPGWLRTDLGGPKAPISVEDGCKTMIKLIHEVPFAFDEKMNAKFFDENAAVFDY